VEKIYLSQAAHCLSAASRDRLASLGRKMYAGMADLDPDPLFEAEFLVEFEGLASTLRIGLAVGCPWSQHFKFLVLASTFHRVGGGVLANPILSR